MSDQGSVPELRVVNRAPQPVFILDGEEVVGAKQNRVVNLSILVPADGTLTIPVSCVEAGRSRARTRGFSAAPRAQYAAGRAKRVMQVSVSLRMSGRRESDQAEVWADIADKSSRLDARSATGAMEEIFSRHAAFTDDAVEAFRPCAHQRGALFLVGGRVAAMDLFDSASTLKRLLPKLVRSVANDALDTPDESTGVALPLRTRIAEHFLALVSECSQQVCDAVGMGQTSGSRRITSPDHVLLGVGTTGFAREIDGELFTIGTLDARVRVYPALSRGFFINGGIGLGSASYAGDTELGLGLMLGVGWDIRVGRDVSLTPFWNGSRWRTRPWMSTSARSGSA